jgi:DNA polymerase-3 subunit gamma/tau
MLTTEAFNALLKTLEEPPDNVVFILATTEPWKVPVTIRSRCQQYKFRNSSFTELLGVLQKLISHEQVTMSENSLALIAKTASGSVRDAENLLDQVIGFSGKEIQDNDVRYVLGIPDYTLLHDALTAVFTHQTAQVFSLMERLVSHGCNLRLFCMEVMERLRNLIVFKIARHPDPYLVLFDYSRAELERYARQTTLSELQQWYWQIADAERKIKYSPNPRFVLEMTLANMTKSQPLEPLEELKMQLETLKAAIADVQAEQEGFQAPPAAQPPSIPSKLPERSHLQPTQELRQMWTDVLELIKQKRRSLAAALQNAIPVELTQDRLTLGFHEEASFSRGLLDDQKKRALIQEALQEYLGRLVQVEIAIHNGAVSTDDMRERLEQHAASRPIPQPQQPAPPSSPRKQRSQRNGGKGNWKGRSSDQPQQYKPPVQVTVQDIVRMFEGEIET